MNYGNIKYLAIEDGIGCRTALFVSGCRHHCDECFQPETWNFDYGKPFTQETEDDIIASMFYSYVEGLTILGGEPFEPENQKDLLPFLRRFKEECPNKTIWTYSGSYYEELKDENSPYHTEYTDEILSLLDVLVDGPFEKNKKNLMLPFRGSENQRVLDMPETLKAGHAVLSIYNDRKHKKGTLPT